MKSNNIIKKIFFIIGVFVLVSCVGTIQDSAKELTSTTIVSPTTIKFDGIISGYGVSHNRIVLKFKAATGGSNNFSYLVYQDGNLSTPVASVTGAQLTVDSLEEYSIIVTNNLVIGTNYTFLIRAFDPQYNVQDTNNVQVSVSTLSYMTPIFDGVQSIENFAGARGQSSLLVKWNKANPATSVGGIFGTSIDAISGYSICYGPSETDLNTCSSINDPNVTSFELNGLTTNSSYFIRVRAKNSAVPAIEDLNMKVLSKKTLNVAPIDFAGVSELQIPSNSTGFSNIKVKWLPGSGNFDRYRIFASTTPVSSFNPTLANFKVSDVSDLAATSATISVNGANTMWYISVVACADNFCTDSAGQNVVKYIKTSPPVASFNGIKTIAPPSGGEGLTSLQMTWDLPDATTGVYDEVRVFKSDAAGNFNSLTDRVDNLAYDNANPSVMGYTVKSQTLLTVNGLPTGTQACFVAMAYSANPFDVSFPDGRTGATKVVKCSTPQYTAPGFAGVKLTCTNIGANKLSVSWNVPNPVGTFEEYEVYYKAGASSFNVSDALSLSTGYTKKIISSRDLSATLTGLSMNENYKILVKTHYYDPIFSIDYHDNNSVIASCSTTSPNVEQKEWTEVFAIGPKFNAISGSPVAEKLTPLTGAINGKDESVNVGKPSWKHQYPVESTGSDLGVTESLNGIIRIGWKDMGLDTGDGASLKDFYSTPNTGYKVYRLPYKTAYGNGKPALSDNWGDPINADYIQATKWSLFNLRDSGVTETWTAQFVDYTLSHPYNTDISKVNEGAIYYYKIEAWYNGKKLATSATHVDDVIRVVLPPKNMSFIHRWMSNKQTCEEMGLQIDRTKNYSCEYNGLGAVLDMDSGNYYYDMKGDLFVDRFEMGCNFSRGASPTAKKCTNVSMSPATNFEGGANGDCIGKGGTPNGKISAAQGSVYLDRTQSNICYINTSSGTGTVWSNFANNFGATMTSAYYESPTASEMSSRVVLSYETPIPPAYSSTASDTFPVKSKNPYYAKYTAGLGYGKLAYSNDAGLPLLLNHSDGASNIGGNAALYYACQSHTIKINSVEVAKRLTRRKEQIVYSTFSPMLSKSTSDSIALGTAQTTNDNAGQPGIDFYTLPLTSHNDRDCNSYNIVNTSGYYYNINDGNLYNNAGFTGSASSNFAWAKIKTATANHASVAVTPSYSDPRYPTVQNITYYGNSLATGSSGGLSTEACTSRYGIQDAIGNGREVTSDLFYCNPTWGCGVAFKDLAQTIPFTPFIDPENVENYRNGNGQYYFMVDSAGSASGASSMGVKLIGAASEFVSRNAVSVFENTCFGSSSKESFTNTTTCSGDQILYVGGTAAFFNLAMGLPMACQGNTCQDGTGTIYDSNIYVTPRATAPLADTLFTNYGVNQNIVLGTMKGSGYPTAMSTMPYMKSMSTGGGSYPAGQNYNNNSYYAYDKYTMKLFMPEMDGQYATGRCGTLIESY